MRAAVAFAALVAAVVLAGCVGDGAAVDALPDGVTVDVYQTRTDVPARGLQIAVTNESADDLTIASAELVSSQFAGSAVWSPRPGGTLVRAGTTVDLPVSLPEAACAEPHPAASVRLGFLTASGERGTAILPALDRYERLPAMRAEECLGEAVGGVVRLTIDGPIRIDASGTQPVAFVPVAVTPTGGTGSVTIVAVEDTVLLALSDGAGAPTSRLPLEVRIDANDPPGAFEIPFVPGRCDPHAIAEDKQGTVIVLDARVSTGETGRIRIPASAATRSSIYDYVATTCGMPR